MNLSNPSQAGCALRKVSFGYTSTSLIVREATFTAQPGEITVLFGPSGVGKTTCLRLIAGLERSTQGAIEIGGRIVDSADKWVVPNQRGVGYCFQEAALWPNVRVLHHIEIPMRPFITDRSRRYASANALLEQYGLTDHARRFPSQLSGGQQRRLALARALACEPRLLLLDEPLSSVEGQLRDEMAQRIRAARRSDRAILLVTHHLEEALSLADRIVILSAGKVIQQGSAQEVYGHPGCEETARLLGYVSFLPAQIENGTLKTELGEWHDHTKSASRAGQAAWPFEGLEAIPREHGPYRVHDCVYLGHTWRVTITYKENQLIARSSEARLPGTAVTAQAIQPPAWIPAP